MRRAKLVLIGALSIVASVSAEEANVPDLEFLEFLGEWQDDGEAWLDVQKIDELSVESEVEDE